MTKDTRMAFIIEDPLAEAFRRLCTKREKSVSGALRELVIRQLDEEGLLPKDFAVNLLASA